MKRLFVLLFSFLVTQVQIAIAATTPATVSYVHPFSLGFAFITDGVDAPCSGSTQWFIRWDNPNANRYYSLVLAANTTGKTISIVAYSCDAAIGNLAVVTDLDMR